jgi:hypothetical protein
MYNRFVQPYLGDRATFQAFVDGKSPTPTAGSLHDELGFELSRLPAGVVLDIQSNTEWSVDVPGGARTLSMKAEGPGVPICYKGFPPTCVTDPHYSIGGSWPTTTPPVAAGSPQAQLADQLERSGAGPSTEWRLPSLADLDTLKAGWKSSDGTLRAWLQAKSGANPATCKAVTAGSTEAVSDPKACVWPEISNLWSDQFQSMNEVIKKNDEGYWAPERTYVMGWRYKFLNEDDGGQPECFNLTSRLDWSDLGGQDYEFAPRGHAENLPDTGTCTGSMVLARTLPAAERSKYYFPV